MAKSTTLLSVAMLVSCAGASTANATTHHVPDEFSTIEAANAIASPGDTILVAPGAYEEGVLQLVPGIRLLSQAGASATTVDVASIQLNDPGIAPPTTIIDGFDLHAASTVINVGNVPNTVVSNNRMTNETNSFCVSALSPISLVGNYIEGWTPFRLRYWEPVSVPGSLVLVDNVFVGFEECLRLYNHLDCPTFVTDIVFDHNTVASNAFFGCEVSWAMCIEPAAATNSIFYRVRFADCDPGDIVFSYNTLFDTEGCVGAPDETNITDDPLFCDPDGSSGELDLRLQPGSPAIGAAQDGSNMGAPLPAGCEVVAVSPHAPARPAVVSVTPNPTSGPVTITLRDESAGAHVGIFDLAGRLVARLTAHGTGEIRWDGRTTAGEPAAPGVYYAGIVRGGLVGGQRAFVIVN